MSIASVITGGYGSFANVKQLPVLGYLPSGSLSPGVAAETDVALALAWRRVVPAALAAETESALATGLVRKTATGTAVEADSAPANALLRRLPAGRAEEADTAFAPALIDAKSIGIAVEIDTAFSRSLVKSLGTSRADETDAAVAPGLARALAPGIAGSTDAAIALAITKVVAVATAVESDHALARSFAGSAVGLSAQHAAWLEGIARLHGLIDPLIVAATSRGDGTVAQTVAQAGGTVTITTTAAPTGDAGESALTDEQAGWLEALARIHGLIDPLAVTTAARGDGTLSQSIDLVAGVTTVTRLP